MDLWVGGYEAAINSNQRRHDPIYKIACGRLPLAEQELLASQPTLRRLANHVSKAEVAKRRSRLVAGFIQHDRSAPEASVRDIDGGDDPTPGEQQLSCFHCIPERKWGIQSDRLPGTYGLA